MSALARRERQTIALGILVAMFILIWGLAVRPILNGFGDRAAQRQELLAQYARGERVITALRLTRAAARAQHATLAEYAILAQDPASALDVLRERISGTARANRALVVAMHDVTAPAGFVAVDLQLTMPDSQLGPFIATLENTAPLLVVEQMTVASDEATVSAFTPRLDVRLSVSVPYAAPIVSMNAAH